MPAILILLAIIALLAIVFLPQYWVTHVIKKHSHPSKQIPGSGGQFARHLLDKFNLQDVSVEQTQAGDHYDPQDRVVRLSDENFNNHSLSAIVIAAHEVGHAIQHHTHYPLFRLRRFLAITGIVAEKAGIVIFMIMPILTLISRAPIVGLLGSMSALALLGVGVLVHLVTLPVEWDASFNRALPVLKAGDYINEKDTQAAHQILKAAAFTYLAGALASLLNFSRWIAILRK